MARHPKKLTAYAFAGIEGSATTAVIGSHCSAMPITPHALLSCAPQAKHSAAQDLVSNLEVELEENLAERQAQVGKDCVGLPGCYTCDSRSRSCARCVHVHACNAEGQRFRCCNLPGVQCLTGPNAAPQVIAMC